MRRPVVTTSLRGIAAGVCAGALAISGLAACSNSEDTATTTTSETTQVQDITVFAAASLKATFTEIGELYEEENPGSTVTFNFAGSSDLVAQLQQGASADAFASADVANMAKAVDADLLAGDPTNFASNTLTIVVAPGNPKNITSLADLTQDGTLLVTCAPQVPCGAAAVKVEEAAGVDLSPVSEESSVTDVLNKVTSGQADAGLVYVTDAANAGDQVTEVPFAESSGVVNVYPIAALKNASSSTGAEAFITLVTGPRGQSILADAGFAQP
ncbi:MAG: molybdate ABC transporter substrate-binding protein [Rhodococcus sp.]|nr:molybdate ABC transporter substrate-binding protein [Rhodococcus sp. (in: high G+C Gram-positive bacteria)]